MDQIKFVKILNDHWNLVNKTRIQEDVKIKIDQDKEDSERAAERAAISARWAIEDTDRRDARTRSASDLLATRATQDAEIKDIIASLNSVPAAPVDPGQ
jgi:hypothetical protein